MILAFAHPAIVVPDLEQAREFYERMFGFRVLTNEGWHDDPVVDRAIGSTRSCARSYVLAGHNTFLELFEYSAPPKQGPDPASLGPQEMGLRHLAFFVDDLETEYRRFIELGGEALGSLPADTEAPRAVYLRDPFGNIVELAEIPHEREDPRRLPGVDSLGDYDGKA